MEGFPSYKPERRTKGTGEHEERLTGKLLLTGDGKKDGQAVTVGTLASSADAGKEGMRVANRKKVEIGSERTTKPELENVLYDKQKCIKKISQIVLKSGQKSHVLSNQGTPQRG